MEDLKLLLIDRLKSKGVDPALIPAFLKALTHPISSELCIVSRPNHAGGPDHLARSPGKILTQTANNVKFFAASGFLMGTPNILGHR